MGEVKRSDINFIIFNCSNRLKSFIDNLDNVSESDLSFILILLGQYLYAKYCTFGVVKGDSYYVYPTDIKKAFNGTKFATYAKDIILLRNLLCHSYGSDNFTVKYRIFKEDMNMLNDFLKYLFPVSPFDSSIGKMTGK